MFISFSELGNNMIWKVKVIFGSTYKLETVSLRANSVDNNSVTEFLILPCIEHRAAAFYKTFDGLQKDKDHLAVGSRL